MLRLCPAETPSDFDPIPFPGLNVRRLGNEKPRLRFPGRDEPADSIRNAEQAMAEVDRRFAAFRDLMPFSDDGDRAA